MATNDRFDHFSRNNVREDQILEAISSTSSSHGGILVGPGDDAAVLSPLVSPLVVSVDQCIEQLHFLPETPLGDVGVKAVRRAAGDLAAMAASPVGLVATAFLPSSMTHCEALRLYKAIQQEAELLDCPLVGGDTCIQRRDSDSGIHLTVTVLGSVTRPVLRSGAKPGDRIFVTGPLGGSFVSGRHLSPPVRIPEALQLRSCLGDDLHAMIDISDGLGKDAMAIASSSHVRVVLEAVLIPCHPGSNWKNALQDGEDHELLFTVAEDADCSGLPFEVVEIGRVAEGTPTVQVVDPEGLHIDGSELGWNHGS
ncbi:MAG: thiamine-phosphate kinase [Planctomycetota bacterium]|nr:thiamine-phosphate kinase [Planctomycetota bacterium]